MALEVGNIGEARAHMWCAEARAVAHVLERGRAEASSNRRWLNESPKRLQTALAPKQGPGAT